MKALRSLLKRTYDNCMHDLCVWSPVFWVCSVSSCFPSYFDGPSVVDVLVGHGCILDVVSSRVYMCDALWVLGDGEVVLVVFAHGCLLDVVLSRVYVCDVLWVQGDGDVILVVFALVMVTLESNCEGKIRISELFDTFTNTEWMIYRWNHEKHRKI